MIRAATPADVPALLALVTRAYRGEASRAGWTTEADYLDGPRTDAGLLREALADPATRVLVADDGALVGTVTVALVGEGVARLGMLAVEPAGQARGLGRRLVAAAEDAGRAAGAGAMEMQVLEGRAELIAWYARQGYAATGETRPFPQGDPRLGTPRVEELRFAVLAKRL